MQHISEKDRKRLRTINLLLSDILNANDAADRIPNFDHQGVVSGIEAKITVEVKALSEETRQLNPALFKELLGDRYWYAASQPQRKIEALLASKPTKAAVKKTAAPPPPKTVQEKPHKQPSQTNSRYQSFDHSGKTAVLAGKFEFGEREDLGYYLEKLEVDIADELSNDVDILIVGEETDEEVAKAGEMGISAISEKEILNFPTNLPETLPAWIQSIIDANLDITVFSNEGDGFQEIIDIETDKENGKDALLAWARRHGRLRMHLTVANYSYPDSALADTVDGFESLLMMAQNPGYYRFYKPDFFAWEFYASGEGTYISGASLMNTVTHFVESPLVMLIQDKPIENSVDAWHLVGGIDKKTKRLVGFMIHRVWT